MIINCYYYAPHNHTLLTEHLDADLRRMAELGTDVVSFCVQEGQLTNWHQQRVRNVVNRIHAHGMEAHAVPNRWAGLVAGWLDGFGRFTIQDPDMLIEDENGLPRASGEMVACVNKPKVREHIRQSLHQLFTAFEFDGLIWDEPHTQACFCRYCIEQNSRPSDDWYNACFARFIDDMSCYAKSLRPGAVISLFVQPHQDALLRALLATEHIDFLGSDGHVRRPEYQMHRMKGTIFEAHARFYPLLLAAGKPAFFLIEAQRHRDEDLDHYVEVADAAFSLPMDHLMYYYSAHEMSPEKEQLFNRKTWAAVKRAATTVPCDAS